MSEVANAPIIIKRKKVVGGDGHHGGAWKVAYADFVTAMMAFFMLMWLLNATTEQQRKGIADYFSPTIPVHRVSGGGAGMFGGDSVFTQQNLPHSLTAASGILKQGQNDNDELSPEEQAAFNAEVAMVAALQNIEETLLGRGGESLISEQALRHVVTRVTNEGLVIELYDVEGAALFEEDSDTPSVITQEIVAMLSRILRAVENPVKIKGHLASRAVVIKDNPVWDLSISRAARIRLLLEAEGFDPLRIDSLTGAADRDPVVADVTAVRNNRIEIIVLRSDT
jgi:chemotaxis protein MotB